MKLKHFATGNANKLREVSQILDVELQQAKLDLLEPQAISVEDIIQIKAKDAYQQYGQPVLVEDTGLEFAAWNGLPGALIKWFLDSVGPEGILKMLSNEDNRQAVAKTVVGYFDGTQVRSFTGQVEGHIAEELSGEQGFGWDALFIPEGYNLSFADMNADQKNQISMRRRALDALKGHLVA